MVRELEGRVVLSRLAISNPTRTRSNAEIDELFFRESA